MKNSFPGHFPPSEHDIGRLWESCLFTVDANILLNLYRYSDSTRKEVLQVFNAIKGRLWLPHRAAQEYFDNRRMVIAQQEKAYEEAIKTIQALQSDLSNARQHPFLSDRLMRRLSTVLREVVTELDSNKSLHAARTLADEIQDAIGKLFDGRVGSSYSDAQLEDICREGEDRYIRKVPPGYKDDGKDEGSSPAISKYKKYGDLVIWRQIMDKANEVKKGIIFINDDKKEDWYLIFRGKTLGPRPELISEFLGKCGQDFYMYQADRFLQFAGDHLKQAITPASVDEIRDLRRQDLLLRRNRLLRLRQEEEALQQARIGEIERHMIELRERRSVLVQKEAELKNWRNHLEHLSETDAKDSQGPEGTIMPMKDIELARAELDKIRHEIASANAIYAMHQKQLFQLQQIINEARERERL